MKVCVGTFGALLLIALVPTAVGHADTQDDRYLAALSSQGITGPPDQLIADGHAACDNIGTPGLAAQHAGLIARGCPIIRQRT
jgi:hypothetical protein